MAFRTTGAICCPMIIFITTPHCGLEIQLQSSNFSNKVIVGGQQLYDRVLEVTRIGDGQKCGQNFQDWEC